MREYDSEERKRSKEEKALLMTNLRDIMIKEGTAVACAKHRRFLFRLVHVGTNIGTSAENLSKDAEREREREIERERERERDR